MPWRRAASAFSRMPPTGSTSPESVISPVIATSDRTGTPRAAETIAVAIVTPADGPSFGIAPAGTWTCRSCLLRNSGCDAQRFGLLPHVTERGARRLLHDAAELPGQRQTAAAARHQHRLDEEDVTARFGPGESRRHAGTRGAERRLRPEARRTEIVRRRPSHRRVAVCASSVATFAATLRMIVPICRSSDADAGFARVLGDHAADRIVGQSRPGLLQPVLLALPRDQIHPRDVDLVLFGVAAERDELHAVEQRRMDRPELVRGRDEQHLREIDRDLEIVIAEGVVLRRIEHLEQRRRGIPLDARPTILSISSSMKTGFAEPAVLSAWTSRPGIEPM